MLPDSLQESVIFQNNLNKASGFRKAEESQKVGTAAEQILLAA